MSTTATTTTRAMPRFVRRNGKRCVSFDCQLPLEAETAEAVVEAVAVAAPLLAMRGLEAVLFADIVIFDGWL